MKRRIISYEIGDWNDCFKILPMNPTDIENWCWVCLEGEEDAVYLAQFCPRKGWFCGDGQILRKGVCLWKYANKPESPKCKFETPDEILN